MFGAPGAGDQVRVYPGGVPVVGAVARLTGIGIDTPSVDYGPSSTFETHRTTMPQNVFHIENAANLTTLPARGFTVVVAPVAGRIGKRSVEVGARVLSLADSEGTLHLPGGPGVRVDTAALQLTPRSAEASEQRQEGLNTAGLQQGRKEDD